MATIPEALQIARSHHRAGRLPNAEAVYREILRVDPDHAEGLCELGLLLNQAKRYDEAIAFLSRLVIAHPDQPDYHRNRAAVCWSAGRLDDAASSLRKAVELRPQDPVVLGHLGAVLTAQGQLEEAVGWYLKSLEFNPADADVRSNLGLTLSKLGRTHEAIEHFRAAAAEDADNPVRCHQLANAIRDVGNVAESLDWYERALALRPAYPAALNNYGNALTDLGRLPAGVECYRKALEVQPDLVQASYNLANAYTRLEDHERAVECYERVIEAQPGNSGALLSLAEGLMSLGRFDEAVRSIQRALQRDPRNPLFWGTLGNAWLRQGRVAEAQEPYERALALDPGAASHHYNLGNATLKRGQYSVAESYFLAAVELDGEFVDAHMNLGNACLGQGKLDAALDAFRAAHRLAPSNTDVHCNLLMNEQYLPDATEEGLLTAHREWDELHAARFRQQWRLPSGASAVDRRLRVGFVSGDLGNHPVASFLVRCLEAIDQRELETVCYSTRFRNDAMSDRIAAATTLWRNVRQQSDDALAEQIRDDRIDILIDLAGHTDKNRLLVFARKPAPVQATWIGYPGTTGMVAMDYLICDRYCVPEGSERHYQERVLRMPDGLACYEPPAEAPAVGPLPAKTAGRVTLGSFNNTSKITEQVVGVWSQILQRVPGAKLVIKYGGFGDTGGRDRYTQLFASHGIDAARLELRGRTKTRLETLQQYNDLDLALDPFPYGGATTTCEALWMGVPVVTTPGATFASRVSQSHVLNAGLVETIARDLGHYVDLTVELANDLDRLAELRGKLRGQMAAAPLCDGARMARNFTQAMREIWADWCRSRSEVSAGT